MNGQDQIVIRGARSHNLKNIDLEIPRGKLVVVTGLSGSGKSSLAFDTLYAEGQRRYMETLSAYARQFMGVLERPQVDDIKGLSPIIAIEQKTIGRNPRSTVGTITEIYDFFRLLYARAATAYSPETGKEMIRYNDEQIVDLIIDRYSGERILLLSPLVKGRKGHYKELFEQLIRKGYNQVRVDGEIRYLGDVGTVDRYKIHFIELVIDKLVPRQEDRKRIRESVVTALGQGKGSLMVLEAESGAVRHYSRNFVCADTGYSLDSPAPHTFSFNSPQGACPHCHGLGTVASVDMSRIIPDPKKSIAEGGIPFIKKLRETQVFRFLEAIADKHGFSLHDPIESIPEEALTQILYGSDELLRIGSGAEQQMDSFGGIIQMIQLTGSESERSRDKKELYIEEKPCPECGGTRLRREALYFKLAGKNIAEVSALTMDRLYDWVCSLPDHLSERQRLIAGDILKELKDRINFLIEVGLEYLSLDRGTRTLSGGESQRIRLATQIGSKLVGVLYILDEPSIGLHQRDENKLIASLKNLRDEGNSVMVVEHDRDMMLAADWLVDLGPGAGEKGGELLFNGKPADMAKATKESLTLDYLLGRRQIPVPTLRRPGNGLFLTLEGARGNNLQNVRLNLPLGRLIGISGVSGSGKSSLITETLLPALEEYFYRARTKPLPYDRIEGLDHIDKVIVIDQSPIGKTPRSNPATYTNAFTDIRNLFAETPDAKVRGFGPGRFSFNIKGGRCEACKGAGIQTIEMHFLPPAYVTCKECGGKRYKPDTLAVRYKGKNISDVLDMSITQALEFFRAVPWIAAKLQTMADVGLGYLTLGQQSTSLSGGESQRLKLSAELSRKETGNTLYILDEPTTGLHFEDIKVLLEVLGKLVERCNTVVIIEHNPDILKSVDYLIDLGPEGGAGGGTIVAEGTPEQVAACPRSYTGQYLKNILKP